MFTGPNGTRTSCELCPAVGAACVQGLIVPLDGFWHSSPESNDVQGCVLLAACSRWDNSTNASRVEQLLEYQRTALENASYQLSLTQLALGGELGLDSYRQQQCAVGCGKRPSFHYHTCPAPEY